MNVKHRCDHDIENYLLQQTMKITYQKKTFSSEFFSRYTETSARPDFTSGDVQQTSLKIRV